MLSEKGNLGLQWLSGRVLDSRPRGCRFEPHGSHCVVSLRKFLQKSKVAFPVHTDSIALPPGSMKLATNCEPPSVHAFTISNIDISETGRPIIIRFHLERHWGGGLAALGFWPDRIRTLVSMATDSSHRVIMGKIV